VSGLVLFLLQSTKDCYTNTRTASFFHFPQLGCSRYCLYLSVKSENTFLYYRGINRCKFVGSREGPYVIDNYSIFFQKKMDGAKGRI
jgi:hypothetical protein